MTKCVFCPELGVVTTATTTSNEAFPFLCTQLGVNFSPSSKGGSSFGGKNGGPCALCSSCHSLWEEVSVLYSNMQGLLNLMGRRVTQFKKNIDKGHGHKNEGPVGTGGGCSTRGRRKRNHPPQPQSPPPDDESMLSWWYPSASSDTATESKKKKKQDDENPGGVVGIDVSNVDNVEADVDHVDEIKFEVEDVMVVVQGDGDADANQGMDLEDFEILPEDRDEDDENSRDDPSYDPALDDSASTPKNAPLRKRSNTTHIWILKSKFDNLEAAKTYVKEIGKFIYYYKKNGKIYYNCKAGRRGCHSKIYIEETTGGVNLFETKGDHNHEGVVARGIPESVKTMIKELFLSGITAPRIIQSNLKLPPEDLPKKVHIASFLKFLKSNKSSQPNPR